MIFLEFTVQSLNMIAFAISETELLTFRSLLLYGITFSSGAHVSIHLMLIALETSMLKSFTEHFKLLVTHCMYCSTTLNFMLVSEQHISFQVRKFLPTHCQSVWQIFGQFNRLRWFYSSLCNVEDVNWQVSTERYKSKRTHTTLLWTSKNPKYS